MTAIVPTRGFLDGVAAAVASIVGATEADEAQMLEHGILRDARRPVRRLGFALDALDATPAWVRRSGFDALFVHRPWHLTIEELPDVGILFSHRPFDERLTTGVNPALAATLGLRDVRTFGERDGRPLAMIGDVDASSVADATARVVAEFGGRDAEIAGDDRVVGRVAIASAMTDALVREAARLGAGLYVTGQLRQPAARAVSETGLHVLAVGHRRSERWGLAALASELASRLPGLECELAEESPPDAMPSSH